MFKKLRLVLVLGMIAIAASAAVRYASAQGNSPAAGAAAAQIEFTRADRGDVAITINATGNIVANQDTALSFAASGKVTAINVKEGDYVLKGQTLATLDDQAQQDAIVSAQLRVNAAQLTLAKLQEKPRQVDIDVAQAAVKAAQVALDEAKISPVDSAQLQIAQLSVEAAKNQLWQAQLNRDVSNQKKASLLSNSKTAGSAATMPSDNQNDRSISSATYQITIAQYQLQDAQSKGANIGAIDSAAASLTSAQVQLQTLLAGTNADDIKQAQANLDAAKEALDQAKRDQEKTRLVAPFSGQIAQINLNVGQVAPASQAITMLDVSSFFVDLPVAEIDIAKIQVGMQVNLHFDALVNTIVSGKVIRIADTANTGTPVTYNVRVQIDPAGNPLLSTMSVTANIVTSNASNVVRLANRFIRIDTAKKKAYATVRQQDGTFKEVEIVLGASNDSYTEIKSGLNAGDIVISPQAGASGGRGGFGGGGLPIRALTGG